MNVSCFEEFAKMKFDNCRDSVYWLVAGVEDSRLKKATALAFLTMISQEINPWRFFSVAYLTMLSVAQTALKCYNAWLIGQDLGSQTNEGTAFGFALMFCGKQHQFQSWCTMVWPKFERGVFRIQVQIFTIIQTHSSVMMMMMMISWKEVTVPKFRTSSTVAVILFMLRCAQLRRLCIKTWQASRFLSRYLSLGVAANPMETCTDSHRGLSSFLTYLAPLL